MRVGAHGTPMVSPQDAITGADIVVGYGRSVLEGMAMGRAAYVWDRAGGDGWVTPETYPMIEADGFSGAATDDVIDRERMRADFAAYRPDLGAVGFDLVRKHHAATEHAEALVSLLSGSEPPGPGDALESLALLVRAETRATLRAGGLEHENKRIWAHVEEAEAAATAAAAAARGAAAAEIDARQRTIDAILSSRTWRLMAPLRWGGSLLRRLRRRAS